MALLFLTGRVAATHESFPVYRRSEWLDGQGRGEIEGTDDLRYRNFGSFNVHRILKTYLGVHQIGNTYSKPLDITGGSGAEMGDAWQTVIYVNLCIYSFHWAYGKSEPSVDKTMIFE